MELDLTRENSPKIREFLTMQIAALADAETFLTMIKNAYSQDIETRKRRGYRPCGRRDKKPLFKTRSKG
ncbi:MAG: hypothetical protein WC998_01595 [Candidatus Paceibacterota bacterium]|jgi:hypothetical protein